MLREVELSAEATVADSGTEVFDLDVVEPLTSLTLKMELENHTASLANYPPERTITRIEIVDGGTTLWSLTGQEAMGAAVVERGRWPYTFYNEALNQGCFSYIPIFFGRYEGDTEFGFDPSQYKNPQLRVTYAKNASHETGEVEMGLWGRTMENMGRPSQCLFWRAVREYTTVASGVEETDLPADYVIRRLLMRCYGTGTGLWSSVSNFKLSCDVDKLVIFDLDHDTMNDIVLKQFGDFTITMKAQVDGNSVREAWLSPVWSVSADPMTQGRTCRAYATWGSYVSVWVKDDAGTDADDGVMIQGIGMNPHSCVQYGFGLPDRPETWFDPRSYRTVRLGLTQATVSHTHSIAIQHVRPVG